MFALEIDFHDGMSQPETILVRRPHAIIGASEFAHVVIEGGVSRLCELRLMRSAGREFICQPIRKPDVDPVQTQVLEGTYPGTAELDLGDVLAKITALDIDMRFMPDEQPEEAGVRVLRRACSSKIPLFPAVAVVGSIPLVISFPLDQSLLIGRSRKCGLRLDASDVSSEHARVGYADGEFWVEDLGSTNGTFILGERVAGRKYLKNHENIQIGSEYTLCTLSGPGDIPKVSMKETQKVPSALVEKSYPCIISTSDLVRPSRFILSENSMITIGREPANDIWIGAGHISRKHAQLSINADGSVEIIDASSNGILYEGEELPHNEAFALPHQLSVLDFSGGVSLALCYNSEDEQIIRGSKSENLQNQLEGEAFEVLEETDFLGKIGRFFLLLSMIILGMFFVVMLSWFFM